MFFFFFDDVEAFLQRSLDSSKDEYYEKEKDLNAVKVDFYLPNGCKKLNYPPRTVIEFVNRLASGTVYRARRSVEQIRLRYDIRGYYIFCEKQEFNNLVHNWSPVSIGRNQYDSL